MPAARDSRHESRALTRGAAIGALVLTSAGVAWTCDALLNRGTTQGWVLALFGLPPLGLIWYAVFRGGDSGQLAIAGVSAEESAEGAPQGRR